MLINKKKAQMDFPIIALIASVIILLIIAPVALKLVTSILTPFSASLANVSGGQQANQSIVYATTTFTNFWDFAILLSFIGLVVMLFLSAFFVDVHPVFLVVYILLAFMLFLFVPALTNMTDNIYNGVTFQNETAALPFTSFINSNFTILILAIIVITGIITYGKLRSGGIQP